MPTTTHIEELQLPATLDGPGGADFVEMVELRNSVLASALGADVLAATAAELLPEYLEQEYEPVVVRVARLGERIVGRAVSSWSSVDDATVSWIEVEVHPHQRGRGIGAALYGAAESAAIAAGHRTVQTEVVHGVREGGRRMTALTGWGDVPAEDPGVRFATDRGFRLEQVGRISLLELPIDPTVESELFAEAEGASRGYSLVSWEGPTPSRWLHDVVALRNHMVADEPTAGLDVEDPGWDETRVESHDRREVDGGRRVLTVAAVHEASGRLAGFSELAVPPTPRPVEQQDTIVLSEHRGRRLGVLLKLANLRRLAEAAPRSRQIVTFNAEENRPMLRINEAIGFRAIGYEGAWRKDLPVRPRQTGISAR